MATVPELKARAVALGLTYPCKIRKADLERMICKAEEAAASRIAPMSNEHRSRVYASQRYGLPLHTITDAPDIGLLTPRQARRIRKHERRNAPATV